MTKAQKQAKLIEATLACLPDLRYYARHDGVGEGPTNRLVVLLVALQDVGVKLPKP